MGYHTYDPRIYQKKVEKIDDVRFQTYEREELAYLKQNIDNSKEKTIIEIGAGYGRGVKQLAKIGKEVIGVELGGEMYAALLKNVRKLENVRSINGDANHLSALVGKVEKPVIVFLQNTLGLWVHDLNKILKEVKKVAEAGNGEIIISSFNGNSFKDWGVPIFYTKIKELVGEHDVERIDYERRVFATKTGYLVKWRNPDEMRNIAKVLGGERTTLCVEDSYQILHVSYSS